MLTEITPLDCPKFVNYLKCLKGLSDNEVSNYLKIIGRGNITKSTVLEETNIVNVTQPYKFLEKLNNANLIFLVSTNGKKIYQVRNPRKIFEEMVSEVKSIDNEIGLLQEKYENTNFDEIHEDDVQILKCEIVLEHELSNLEHNKFEIQFCLQKTSKIRKVKRFNNYKKIEANLDFILFSNNKKFGVILLESEEEKNMIRVKGIKINSKEQFNKFQGLKNGK